MKLDTFRPAAYAPMRGARLVGDPVEEATPTTEPVDQERPTPWLLIFYIGGIVAAAAFTAYAVRQIDRGAPGWR